jgi:uncharacterized membrane protein YkvA (DUF1232 family)
MKLGAKIRRRAARLKRQLWAVYLAMKDPGTPWHARALIVVTIAYAASPIDLIPDFIPILGQLDDLIIVPALIALSLKLIPKDVVARCRREAWKRLASGERVKSKTGIAASVVFATIWLGIIVWLANRFFP